MSAALWVLGNQLFPWGKIEPWIQGHGIHRAYMAEDPKLCTYFRFHQQKLVLFLASMRKYADELRSHGLSVDYDPIDPSKTDSYEARLIAWCRREGIDTLVHAEVEDRWFEAKVKDALTRAGIRLLEFSSPMFLTTRGEFAAYLKKQKKPFMKTFYVWQRKRLNLLLNEDGSPLGGKWSFDSENRRSLPANERPEPPPTIVFDDTVNRVTEIVEERFADHPGSARGFWLPTDRNGYLQWLDRFIERHLEKFGPYQDALAPESSFVFHSIMTPGLNLGLITPDDVIERVMECGAKPLASVEGLIRQVIGWREFVRGIDRHFGERQEKENFFDHKRQLSDAWYRGDTGVPPLDQAIQKAIRYGYAHHIERLMVLSNFMVLCEVAPSKAYGWFMEMFVDSSDWVMGPNVYGMGLYSDGGLFATKPYICGSNYYRKMGKYPKGDWCDAVDGLYWSFIDRHRTFFASNPRLSIMVRSLDRMDPKRKKDIFSQGRVLRDRLTHE